MEQLGTLQEEEVRGERGEAIHYLSARKARGALGIRAKQSDSHGVPYERYSVGVHHVALKAASREVVDNTASWLEQVGATIESAPREYDYSPGYYAVFFRDPDGIKLEVAHRPG
jgi:catechol 2,3-dioxygenase-like lactoylglutathione lyase family enzyme